MAEPSETGLLLYERTRLRNGLPAQFRQSHRESRSSEAPRYHLRVGIWTFRAGGACRKMIAYLKCLLLGKKAAFLRNNRHEMYAKPLKWLFLEANGADKRHFMSVIWTNEA